MNRRKAKILKIATRQYAKVSDSLSATLHERCKIWPLRWTNTSPLLNKNFWRNEYGYF